MDGDEPTTQELRLGQLGREREERDRAARSDSDSDGHAHERRADKAAYLGEKLAERERAEAEAEPAVDEPADPLSG